MTGKFVSPEPPPSPYEREILEILIEECAEIQQRATKMLRFGVMEVQPGQDLSNRDRLSDEIGDLRAVLHLAEEAGLLDMVRVKCGVTAKFEKLDRYMQTEPSD